MNGKLSNIGKWVFGLLAVITVALAVYFATDVKNDARISVILNWGYILIILGIVMALFSVVFSGIVKGVNTKTLLIAVVAAVVIGVVAYLMAKNCFSMPYQAGEITYPGKTHGWVEFGLDFFYITLGVSLLSIVFSIVYKAIKK